MNAGAPASAARRLRALELTLFGYRLRSQHLTGRGLENPAAIVAWLGAVQSQDYAGAKWGLAQRGHGITERAIDTAFDQGQILRTHMMRPTWHFVAPADIRWMQSLTSPRVHTVSGSVYRRLEFDRSTLSASRRALERALGRDDALTRTELQAVLRRAGIPAAGLRLAYLMMHAELEQVIASGPRRGKQFTYALLDRRAPRARLLHRDEALAELTLRYFSSHGPATIRDLSWWSGLTMKEAREGVEHAKAHLTSACVLDRTYWFVPPPSGRVERPRAAYLLPNYDECLIAYKDRGSLVDRPAGPPSKDLFAHHLLVGDRVIGSWRRTGTGAAAIDVQAHRPLTGAESRALAAAARAYSAFIGRPATLDVTAPRAV